MYTWTNKEKTMAYEANFCDFQKQTNGECSHILFLLQIRTRKYTLKVYYKGYI